MSKHTEGPWSTNHVGFTHAKNGACIAEVGIDVLPFDEVEANARLIDASPDLLEALEELVAYVDEMHRIGHIQRPAQSSKAVLAIAKARGEE